MKEITRIHLAKVAYDIELDAKKDVQKYITALERYAGDAELLDDIEIRITELLAERGVMAGGVITKEDVAAVRAQLGEPSDFAPEGAGDIAVGGNVGDSDRKLYRDGDSAILGGVLAGMGRFFGIDPLWIRLIFIVILIASFGMAFVVYLILWLIIPVAKTAAEKLQMRGRPVTLEAIKALGEYDDTKRSSTEAVRRTLRYAAGIVLLVGAIGALVATLFIGLGLTFGTTNDSPLAHIRPQESWWLATALGMFVLAGVLLATLGFILANTIFRSQWSKRIGTTVVIIITVGLISFFSGVGTMWYGSWQENMRVYNFRKISTIRAPRLADVTKLIVDKNRWDHGELRVEYIVSDDVRYELETVTNVKPRIIRDGETATLSLDFIDKNEGRSFTVYMPTVLRVYGPALQKFDVKQNVNASYYNEKPQEKLAITLQAAGLELNGTYNKVTVLQRETGRANLERATVGELRVDNQGGMVEAGVVRTLNVTQPDACPANSNEDGIVVHVQSVSSGKMHYNGVERQTRTIRQDCGAVFIGNDDDSYREGYGD